MTPMAIEMYRVRKLCVTGLLFSVTPALLAAQAVPAGATVGRSPVRITATMGGIAPRRALIVDPLGGGDTRLGAAPAFGLELQVDAVGAASVFAGVGIAFTTLTHGTNLGVVARGVASDASVVVGTGGLFLEAPSSLFGSAFRPTLRLGGGVKRYSFSTPGSTAFLAPSGDVGGGFRTGGGDFELSAEVRYLPSAFDQAKLPVRGIVAQKQQQRDLLFGIGVTVRP